MYDPGKALYYFSGDALITGSQNWHQLDTFYNGQKFKGSKSMEPKAASAAAANLHQANQDIDITMSQIKFDLAVSPVQNPPANNQNNFNRGITSNQNIETISPANDAVLRNMQNQGQNLQSQMANLTDMLSKFVTANTASTSGSGTLPGNTVTNPKEDLKGITTRSGVTIQGPKAVNHDIEVTKDTMPPANNGSTEDVQPPVVQVQTRNPNPEPNVAPVVTPVPKASIPFPSRRNDERRKEKETIKSEIYEIFRDLSFEIALPLP
ncbi:hypothetical protein Tco_1274582 [Tanacetum coccineum]